MTEQIKFLRKIKNLDLVRRVKDPEGEMTAFDKFSSWWPSRGKLEKLPEALEVVVKPDQYKVLKLFKD